MIRLPASTPSFRVQTPAATGFYRQKRAAFTLIETALALGIVAFALVPIIGMLPIGLQLSRTATDLTISAQIAQRLTGMVQQDSLNSKPDGVTTEFDLLNTGLSTLEKYYFYFDGSGQPVPINGTRTAVPVYAACILYAKAPGMATPIEPSLSDDTKVMTLNIQVVNDPGQQLKSKTPMAKLPDLLQARSVTIPIYVANTGN